MTMGTNNWEEEMTVMKAKLEKLIKEKKKKRCASSCMKKRLPG